MTTEFPGLERLRNSGEENDRWGIRADHRRDRVVGPLGPCRRNLTCRVVRLGCRYRLLHLRGKPPGAREKHRRSDQPRGRATRSGCCTTARFIDDDYLEYYDGHGSGPTGWASIMGDPYDQGLTQWDRGEFAGASNRQDDLAIITTQNGFGYRMDDHGNTRTAATRDPLGLTSIAGSGVIERRTDADYSHLSPARGR